MYKQSLKTLVNYFKKVRDEYDGEINDLTKKQEVINTKLIILNEQRNKVDKLYQERNKELNEV